MKKYYFIVFLLLSGSVVFGQLAEAQQQYRSGKQLFNAGKYELAKETFKSLTSDGTTPFGAYASFYYALSAQRLGQLPLAKNMLLQTQTRYPDWDNMSEVNYWLAVIYFQEGNFYQGLDYAALAGDDKVSDLKQKYLKELVSVDELQSILEQSPYDKDVATVLADKIMQQPFSERNVELLDFLIVNFELPFDDSFEVKSKKKEVYTVSVLFPYMSKTLNVDRMSVNRPFSLDLYEGMRIAVDSLKKEKIKIKLQTFDTRKDSAYMAKLLDKEVLFNTDLVVGPLYPEEHIVVSNYCYDQQLNMINPLSSNPEIIETNPFAFLFQSSILTQATQAAQFAAKAFEKKTAAIFYTPADSLIAFTYRRSLIEDSVKVIIMKEIKVENYSQIINVLTNQVNGQLKIATEDLGHIFVASTDELVVSNAIGAIEIRRDKIPIVIFEEVLQFRSTSLNQLDNIGAYIISPSVIPPSTQKLISFQYRYLAKTGSLPSEYVIKGFEMMYVMGHVLNKYGTYFQLNWQNDSWPGYFSSNYQYKHAHDRQTVPILRIKDAEFEFVTPEMVIKEQQEID